MSINIQETSITWSALFEELEVVFSFPQPESSFPWAAQPNIKKNKIGQICIKYDNQKRRFSVV